MDLHDFSGFMSKRFPRVSVILPTYNNAQLLKRAIKSVLNQGFRDLELIIVDDGSSDHTGEVVKGFKEPRIRYIRHKSNRGASVARNTGIGAAKGEFIAFQDSDDEWMPEKLEKQVEAIERSTPDTGAVYTGFWRFEGDKKTYIPYSRVLTKEGDIYRELLKGNFVGTPTLLIKKRCIEIINGFDENLPRFQDWEFLIRLSRHYKFKCLDEPLVNSYYRGNSISSNPASYIDAFEYILSKHISEFIKEKNILARHYYTIGDFLCLLGEFKKGRNYFLKALRLNPKNLKFLLTAFLLLFGQHIFAGITLSYRKIKNIVNSS